MERVVEGLHVADTACAAPRRPGCRAAWRARARPPPPSTRSRPPRAPARRPRRSARAGSRGSCPRPRAGPRGGAPGAHRPDQARVHAARRRRLVQRVEVDAGRAAREQLATLQRGPLDADLERALLVRLAHRSSACSSSRGVSEVGALRSAPRRFARLTIGMMPGTIGTVMPAARARADEAEVVLVVQEELGDQELGAGVDLAPQVREVGLRASALRDASPDSSRRRCRTFPAASRTPRARSRSGSRRAPDASRAGRAAGRRAAPSRSRCPARVSSPSVSASSARRLPGAGHVRHRGDARARSGCGSPAPRSCERFSPRAWLVTDTKAGSSCFSSPIAR